MVENKFWIVRSLSARSNEYEMHNSIPSIHTTYYGTKYWSGVHSNCYLGKQSWEKVSDITRDTEPVAVRLVPTDSDEPDFYVQRCGENLFIGNRLEKYYTNVKRKLIGWKCIEEDGVPHMYRISNKLFPEITDECGPVKFNIERI